MPEFCPKCGNMVGAGIERCPECGSRIHPGVLDKNTGFTWADLFNYSWVTIMYILLAISVPLLVAVLCVYLAQ